MDRRSLLKVLAGFGLGSTAGVTTSSKDREEEGLEGLERLTENRFARWACELNCWQWPLDWQLPERFRHKLEDLDGRERYEYCKEEYAQIIGVLESLAGGKKEVCRYWNVVRCNRMTDKQFDQLYECGNYRPTR